METSRIPTGVKEDPEEHFDVLFLGYEKWNTTFVLSYQGNNFGDVHLDSKLTSPECSG